MAGTAVKVLATDIPTEGLMAQMRAQINALVVDVEKLRLAVDTIADQLDADAGVTDTTYATNAAVATAATMTAATVNVVG